jgi:hypothetical protein
MFTSKGAPLVSMTSAVNLPLEPLVSLIQMAGVKFATDVNETDVNETGGK